MMPQITPVHERTFETCGRKCKPRMCCQKKPGPIMALTTSKCLWRHLQFRPSSMLGSKIQALHLIFMSLSCSMPSTPLSSPSAPCWTQVIRLQKSKVRSCWSSCGSPSLKASLGWWLSMRMATDRLLMSSWICIQTVWKSQLFTGATWINWWWPLEMFIGWEGYERTSHPHSWQTVALDPTRMRSWKSVCPARKVSNATEPKSFAPKAPSPMSLVRSCAKTVPRAAFMVTWDLPGASAARPASLQMKRGWRPVSDAQKAPTSHSSMQKLALIVAWTKSQRKADPNCFRIVVVPAALSCATALALRAVSPAQKAYIVRLV